MTPTQYVRNAELPTLKFWWRDVAGNLIDFTGFTWNLTLFIPGTAAVLTKTTNIAGAPGAGVEPTGTANVVVTWVAGDLNLAPAVYALVLAGTSGGLNYTYRSTLAITTDT